VIAVTDTRDLAAATQNSSGPPRLRDAPNRLLAASWFRARVLRKHEIAMLVNVVAVIGPPAAGKTTLAMQIDRLPGTGVFRLREHVPENSLAATVTNAVRPGWIDDITVITSVREYLENLICEGEIHTLLLDNFPGRGTQVGPFLSALWQLAPGCIVQAIELVADPDVLRRRAVSRRVCHHCERDPLPDPRLPAMASALDPGRCACCEHLLHTRRGDIPAVYELRNQRYHQRVGGIRCALSNVGITVTRLDGSQSLDVTTQELTSLLF
jgi:adenylate kinase